MNNGLKTATIFFAGSLLAGCAAQMSPAEMKTAMAGQSVEVQIPANSPGIPFGAGAPATATGTAGATAASNGFIYGHAAQLDKQAEKQTSGVSMSSGAAFTIASSLKSKYQTSKIAKEPTYQIRFDEGKFLISAGLNSYWVNYVLKMEVHDAQGKRVHFEACWIHDRDAHSIDEWRTSPALVEGLRQKLVTRCLQQFSAALGG